MAVERLDKLICKSGKYTRSQIKKLIRSGEITVNGIKASDSSEKVESDTASVFVCGEKIDTVEHIYIMLNKPKGVVSASEGKGEITVVDILPENMKRKGLFPAGRLDKDTTGFVLITDDGDYAHRILSPKNHIKKTYIASLDKPLDDNSKKILENGIVLKDSTVFKPAEVEYADDKHDKITITIYEGKYHQVKRMFKAVGCTVIDLKRIKMGNVCLDNSLESGQARFLTEEEIRLIEKK